MLAVSRVELRLEMCCCKGSWPDRRERAKEGDSSQASVLLANKICLLYCTVLESSLVSVKQTL